MRLTTAYGGASPQGEAFWWPFYPNIISRCICSSHSTNASRGTPMKSAQDVRSTAEGEIFK